jgi:GntR family transcriptional repressor for pyruvate dehydrogenase complex
MNENHTGMLDHDPAPTLISRPNVYQMVAERLTQEIVDQQLAPGTPVPTEREISERYGVGRSSVREGLRLLESHQVIRPSARGSYVVGARNGVLVSAIETLIALGSTSMGEVHELRRLLEIEVAGRAARMRTDEDLARIRGALQQMIENRTKPAVALAADLAFHVAMAQASHNGAMIAAVLGVRTALNKLIATSDFDVDEAIAQHQLIVEAIVAKDEAGARERVTQHMNWIAGGFSGKAEE